MTSLIWVLFWAVGVFEVPEGVKNLLGISPTALRYQRIQSSIAQRAVFDVGWESQALPKWAAAFARIEGSIFGPTCEGTAASRPVLRTEISPDRNNTTQFHGFAAN